MLVGFKPTSTDLAPDASYFSGPADGDGRCELVLGYTDRVVRAFRWEDLGDGTEHLMGQLVSLKKWMLEGQVRSRVWRPQPRNGEGPLLERHMGEQLGAHTRGVKKGKSPIDGEPKKIIWNQP